MRRIPLLVVTSMFIGIGTGGAVEDIELVTLKGGNVTIGSDTEYSAPIATNMPAHRVKLKKFKIGKYEVTNRQYVDFLNEAELAGTIEVRDDLPGSAGEFVVGAAGHPSEGRKLYELSGTNQDGESELNRPWIDYDASAPVGTRFMVLDSQAVFGNNDALDTADWPASFVKWDGAAAFAYHCGLALPTEAQWEYAARGGQDLAFGTDDGTISLENANYSGTDGPGEIDAAAVGHAVAVGSYPPNPFGLYDLAGNVWEWTADFYDPDFYADSAGDKDPVNTVGIDGTSTDPAEADGCTGGPSTVYSCNTRLKRGGSWNFHQAPNRSDARNTDYVFRGNDHFGFRVVGTTKKPKKPGKLTSEAGSGDTVTLSWQDKAYNEAMYEIECSSATAETVTASTYPNVEWVDVELASASSYSCQVRASNAVGASGWKKLTVQTRSQR